MSLARGQQIGQYEIGDSIGVGGMGEVFRATDTKLKRDVAIKVLPESFAKDADRLARFQREAEMLASLNHPNIAQIYGIEEFEGSTALVMELVEGPTLADRIAEGPIPPDEALMIARQVINALEAAHEQHIVHRDLKPANIKLRDDGVVKVLDFGIAKPLEARGISGGSVSPAMTTPAMTETGLIMGTAAYMSPEQARGRRVDQRTDVWAFGCVLFEMLTGQPAFGGEDVTVTLARVIERDTDLDSIPGAISPSVRHTLRMCLVKDPKNRIADIRDVRLALAGEFESLDASLARQAAAIPAWRGMLPVSLAAALIAGLGVWLLVPAGQQGTPSTAEVIRYTLPLNVVDEDADDEEPTLYLGGGDAGWGWPALNALAFSNDGTRLAYAVREVDENSQPKGEIVMRRLDQERGVPIPGTAMAFVPFFSPDDQYLGFFHEGAMKRINLASGNIETIVTDPMNFRAGLWGAHWLEDGTIVFAGYDGLFRIRQNGTELQTLLAIDRGAGEFIAFVMPQMLPGGNNVLFHTLKVGQKPEDGEVRALDLATGEHRVLLTDAAHPWYLPETGQLLFMRRGALMSVDFDAAAAATMGDPVMVLDNVVQALGMPNAGAESAVGQFSVSAAGHLAYVTGGTYPRQTLQMLRIDQDGKAEPMLPDEYNYLHEHMSPDGSKLAFGEFYGTEGHLFIHDMNRGITTRLNTGTDNDRNPLWSPDGRTLLYTTIRQDNLSSMYLIAADNSGDPQRIAPEDNVNQMGADWSSTGVIAYLRSEANKPPDIWVIPPEGEPAAFFTSDGVNEAWPKFSPDGNWLMYSSREDDQWQVYVRPYPEASPATRISGRNGQSAVWAPDGRTIYFHQMIVVDDKYDRTVIRKVTFTPGNPPVIGREETVIDNWVFAGAIPIGNMEVLADGTFMVPGSEEGLKAHNEKSKPRGPDEFNGRKEVRIVLNFIEEMKQRARQ